MEQNTSINGSTGLNNDDALYFRIILAIEIPIMILTLVALCALIKSQRSAPVFVINLILSDLIQISCMSMYTTDWLSEVDAMFVISAVAHTYSLMVGLYFMACVAFERYLLVSHPIWYKSHHSVKVSCVISVIIWFVPLMFMFSMLFNSLSLVIGALIPYPIVILCFVGTCCGLSHAISLTSLKRKLILGRLFLVLLTYTFLILPSIIQFFVANIFPKMKDSLLLKVLDFLCNLVFLNPMADCLLYLFMRPDAADLMKSVCCCCRTDTHQNSTHSRDEHSRDSRATFTCCVSEQNPASLSQTVCSSV